MNSAQLLWEFKSIGDGSNLGENLERGSLNTTLDLNDLLSCFMDNLWASELTISNFSLADSAQRLRIRRSNFRLPLDIQSKESTFQVVYDVLRRSPFFKAFLVMAYVLKIYMQEFWATAKVHQHSIRFKMDTRKHIVDLEAFREMLHISPRILGRSFAELPFEEEILEFLRFLGHSAQIKTLADSQVISSVNFMGAISQKKRKQPARATSPTDPSDVERNEAKQLKIVLRRSRHETDISYTQQTPPTMAANLGSTKQTLPYVAANSDNTKQTLLYWGGGSKVWGRRVRESGIDEQVDRKTSNLFGFAGKIPPEKFSGGGRRRRMVVAGWAAAGGGGERISKVYRVKSLEVNFLEFMRTNQSPEAVSNIPDSIQRENDEFLRTIDDNMKKIIKEQVKSQVKAQVTRIFPRIKESVNAQLEAEVLTRSSHSLRTSYAVAADLLKMELKKILIDKMEGNKESAILKRRREDDDDQEGPFARSDQGLRDEEKVGSMHQPALYLNQLSGVQAGLLQRLNLDRCLPMSLLLQRNLCRLPVRWRNPHIRCLKQVQKINPLFKLLSILNGSPSQGNHQHRILDWDNPEGQQYPHNLLQPLSLIPDNRGRRVIPFAHFINNDLEYLRGESALDVYSKRRIIAITDLKIMEWHNYKHLDWISKRLNLTKPDTYRSNLKRREAYTAYLNPRGFIYQNKDKKNRLMRIDELQKFSDGTLNDVRNALDDRLKGIRMQYLPTTI
uniref:Uncharacterized protein n=1 Tax=Tanacetum cinerariifolium TaxID=118510 RepID=A0A6L2LC69_TANCI|nr:hypothetical protein [Tanacetum cinerariifolium]